MSEVSSRLVRKSLHTRLAEALDQRGEAWEIRSTNDGRIAYVVYGIWYTPGELAAKVDIPVLDEWR